MPFLNNETRIKLLTTNLQLDESREIISVAQAKWLKTKAKRGCSDCLPCHFREVYQRDIDLEEIESALRNEFEITDLPSHGEQMIEEDRDGLAFSVPDGIYFDIMKFMQCHNAGQVSALIAHKWKYMIDAQKINRVMDHFQNTRPRDENGVPLIPDQINPAPFDGHRRESLPVVPVTPRFGGRSRTSFSRPPPVYSPRPNYNGVELRHPREVVPVYSAHQAPIYNLDQTARAPQHEANNLPPSYSSPVLSSTTTIASRAIDESEHAPATPEDISHNRTVLSFGNSPLNEVGHLAQTETSESVTSTRPVIATSFLRTVIGFLDDEQALEITAPRSRTGLRPHRPLPIVPAQQENYHEFTRTPEQSPVSPMQIGSPMISSEPEHDSLSFRRFERDSSTEARVNRGLNSTSSLRATPVDQSFNLETASHELNNLEHASRFANNPAQMDGIISGRIEEWARLQPRSGHVVVSSSPAPSSGTFPEGEHPFIIRSTSSNAVTEADRGAMVDDSESDSPVSSTPTIEASSGLTLKSFFELDEDDLSQYLREELPNVVSVRLKDRIQLFAASGSVTRAVLATTPWKFRPLTLEEITAIDERISSYRHRLGIEHRYGKGWRDPKADVAFPEARDMLLALDNPLENYSFETAVELCTTIAEGAQPIEGVGMLHRVTAFRAIQEMLLRDNIANDYLASCNHENFWNFDALLTALATIFSWRVKQHRHHEAEASAVLVRRLVAGELGHEESKVLQPYSPDAMLEGSNTEAEDDFSIPVEQLSEFLSDLPDDIKASFLDDTIPPIRHPINKLQAMDPEIRLGSPDENTKYENMTAMEQEIVGANLAYDIIHEILNVHKDTYFKQVISSYAPKTLFDFDVLRSVMRSTQDLRSRSRPLSSTNSANTGLTEPSIVDIAEMENFCDALAAPSTEDTTVLGPFCSAVRALYQSCEPSVMTEMAISLPADTVWTETMIHGFKICVYHTSQRRLLEYKDRIARGLLELTHMRLATLRAAYPSVILLNRIAKAVDSIGISADDVNYMTLKKYDHVLTTVRVGHKLFDRLDGSDAEQLRLGSRGPAFGIRRFLMSAYPTGRTPEAWALHEMLEEFERDYPEDMPANGAVNNNVETQPSSDMHGAVGFL